MTLAVIDASVVAAALLDSGDDGRWSAEQLARLEIAAPHLILVEASNVIRRAVLSGGFSEAEGSMAHSDLARMNLELFSFAPLADRIWELRSNVTSYDAWYVALAERLGSPLLTLDERLARAAGVRCEIRTRKDEA